MLKTEIKKIIVIGSVPPPYHGVSVINEVILNSELPKRFHVLHINTSDKRKLANIGKLDFRNIWLAIQHSFTLVDLLSFCNPDIVYLPICQTIKGLMRDAIFIFMCKMKNAKIIIHLHGSYLRKLYQETNFFGKFLIKTICKSVTKAIVLGDSLRYIFADFIPDTNITVIPNGIDVPHEINIDNNRGRDNYRILYLSSLKKSKGYLDIIHAVPEILRFSKSIEFIFAGELRITDKEREHIFNFIKKHQLTTNIKYAGVVNGDEKWRLFLSADIFVFPSHNEGQPLAILEAMAAGLPIITTDTGAIKEMVVNAENGFIVGMQNPKQIAQKIIKLLKNNYLRKQMGEKSRERFLKYYTKDKFIDNLSHVFESVLTENIMKRRKR